jgi:hypothetical protein
MLSERMECKKNKAESLKHYLSDMLYGTKFESSRNKISWRKSDEVYIIEENIIPSEYKETITETKISKSEIKKAIKSGIVVTGATLVQKNNIQIK